VTCLEGKRRFALNPSREANSSIPAFSEIAAKCVTRPAEARVEFRFPNFVSLNFLGLLSVATDFRAFVEYVFGLLRPGTPFKPNWHIDAMAHKVSQVATGEVKRLIITVPPRHLKSIIASVALPAWYLGHNPSERVVCVSYSADLAKTHANDFRRVVTDPVYQAVFPRMIVSRETDSEIHTTLRGRRYATSVGGTLTGRGGNLIIIDDPLKPSDAVSDVTRPRVIEWYSNTLSTRADDKQIARM
jgi:hypothetical protein